jgi:hypothetical protein
VDGREFLARQPPNSFDAIVIDAFVGASVAAGLITDAAALDAARVAPLALVNVIDDRAARHIRSVASTLASAYPTVRAINGRSGNTVLLAGSLATPALDRIAAQLAGDASPAGLAVLRLT